MVMLLLCEEAQVDSEPFLTVTSAFTSKVPEVL